VWSGSRPFRFSPGERPPGTLWIDGWVSPSIITQIYKFRMKLYLYIKTNMAKMRCLEAVCGKLNIV